MEMTVDTCSGIGGKDAADAASSIEDTAPRDFKANAMTSQCK